jgi:hypothetical protein
MQIYQNAWFARFAFKEGISQQALCDAVNRANAGLIDASLGGGLIKQRVARRGQGKSGGYRTIILFRTEVRALFVFGFAKNDRANLSRDEELIFKKLANVYLMLSDAEMDRVAVDNKWTKVECYV